MAQISLQIDGRIRVQDKAPGNDCLMLEIDKDLVLDDGYRHPIQRDVLYLHGDATELRAFAAAILAALPVQVQTLPEPEDVPEMPAGLFEVPSC